MANIKITDLHPSGYKLGMNSISYLDNLDESEISSVKGGFLLPGTIGCVAMAMTTILLV